ncbi:hypothetical protein [Pseudidiomarina taiwanensis]|uniref:Lipoprotein n=1 Tax=Pseudidiomarina taiwanensis TaxID=337250 RepID=A0A432ZK20_9GAMM|nr:hypothetical protein [Pseudidiomarina taiwanensis]RUO78367.1 hypothetical protein CWI83_04880 [Pseudidiomarina taiwanensis]
MKGLNFLKVSIGLLLLAAVGCSEAPTAADEQVKSQADPTLTAEKQGLTVAEQVEKLSQLDKEIRSMAGTAVAQSAQQCRVVAVGSRPCGGPEYYLAYSVSSVDETQLLALVTEYSEMRQGFDAQQGIVGTCEVIPEPKLVFIDGYCRALPAATY